MARLKVQGARKVGRPPKNPQNTQRFKPKILKQRKKQLNSQEFKPHVISARRYREIFGSSDDEEEDFYGFRSEDLGLVAYRKITSPISSSPRTFGNKGKHGVLSLQSDLSWNSPKKSFQQIPLDRQDSKEEREENKLSKSENVYAKQYRKRESYERKYTYTPTKLIPKTTEPSPKLKSTSKVKFNFAPRGERLINEINSNQDNTDLTVPESSKNTLPSAKRKPQSVAKMLLAKAKGGKSLQIRRQQQVITIKPPPPQPVDKPPVKTDGSEVRSRSGRVVKAKKLDYNDFITPSRVEAKRKGDPTLTKSLPQKRSLENGEMPVSKIQRVDEDEDVSKVSDSAKGNSMLKSQDAHQNERKKPLNKQLTIKKTKKLQNKDTKVKNKPENKVSEQEEKGKDIVEKTTEGVHQDVDQTLGLKVEQEQSQNDSSLLEETNGENVVERSSEPSIEAEETSKCNFRSKRLQQRQEEEKKQRETLKAQKSENDNDEEGSVPDEELEEETSEESETSSNDSKEDEDTSEDDWKPNSRATNIEKTKKSILRKERNEKLEDVDESYSSDDEESNKPLALIQKELKESPKKKVVTKVIRVVKKIKLKDGTIKKKLIKVIKRVRKVDEDACPKIPGMRRTRCKKCSGCKVKNDCGNCVFCKDKPKFGGAGSMKQACSKRRCVNPQPPKAVESLTKKDVEPKKLVSSTKEKSPKKVKKPIEKSIQKREAKAPATKPKPTAPKKKNKEIKLKAKHTKKYKNNNKEEGCETTTSVIEKPQFITKKRMPPTDTNTLIKLPWSDNAPEETIWKEGFGVCFTSGIPESVQEGCFLCGSTGQDKMFYCKVCAEPFHGYCLEEEPVDESTWCCDNCSTCVVCGLQDKLLMCDICQRGYHVECLGPNYPTEPEGEDDIWICGRCVKCKICGTRSAGSEPEATWMHEFTHCYSCGTNWDQGNYCPICEKCYSDNDFDSKMMQCATCDHWVHASCHDINEDQYECLSDLPDCIPFVCKLCSDEENPKWFQELNEEMFAGFSRVLEGIVGSKEYKALTTYFEEIQVDNGHPKDFHAIKEKAKENKYKYIGEFCDDIQVIFNRALKIKELQENPVLSKNVGLIFSIFARETAAMFPWHKIKTLQETPKEEEKEVFPVVPIPKGMLGKPITLSTWDHSYFQPLSNQDKKSTVTKSSTVHVSKQEEKMDIDKAIDTKADGSQESTVPSGEVENKNMEPELGNGATEKKEESLVRSSTDVEMADNSSPQLSAKATPKPLNQKNSKSNKSNKKGNGMNTVTKPIKKLPQYTEADEELGLKSVLDTRKCQLCGYYGDDESPSAGRLLCSGLDEWVHVNCGLWSAEVFEDDDGKLQNVQSAISRGKQMKCEHCGETGATVGCCEPRCPSNYHFMCARNAKSVFQDDKKVYCDQHSFRANKELILQGDQFRMDRRVFIDLSKVRTIKKGLKGAEPDTIKLVQGSMRVESLGRLTESSDNKEGIFPIGYKISRLYWSAVDPRRRCRYYCTIVEKPREKIKTCSEDTSGMATIDDTVHTVIAHDEVDKPSSSDRTKQIDLTCSESSHQILNPSHDEHGKWSQKGPGSASQKGPLCPSTDQKGHNSFSLNQKGPVSPSKDLKGPSMSSTNQKPHVIQSAGQRGLTSPITDHKEPLSLFTDSKHVNNTCTKDKSQEITRILSGLKQILPSRPPTPIIPITASPLSSPRKILPNIQKNVRFPSTVAGPIRSSVQGPIMLPLSVPIRRKAEPLVVGLDGPKAKKQRISDSNDQVKSTAQVKALVSNLVKDRINNQEKRKNLETPILNQEKEKKTTTQPECSGKIQENRKSLDAQRQNVKKESVIKVKFVIKNDDGLKIESDSYKNAWKIIYEMVREARADRLLKDVPFIGLHNVSMLGLKQESVAYLLEQLPGAHQLKKYKFKYNAPFAKNANGGEYGAEELKENPSGCCRTEVYKRTKKYDMFAFLSSIYRTPPQLADDADDQDWSEPNYDNPMAVKRATALDLPMAMRYRQLKENGYNKNSVAVYRSGIHGRGLYCARNIAAGELVIEYSGVLIRSSLTDKREKYYDSKGIGCYMFRVDEINVVDATTSGNAARFINHSCECNCYSKIATVDGQKKILIFAARSISRGEELTYDYKFPVEDEKLPCLCNSKRCRKYLN
ncbi:histone-lysine N-methyltransferase 2A-like [Actinia tenebrosa]|uniref:Histone-lysine N-methyltransferase 2A-like n=1 Tax=Actinia tenebrosa TaxID=6105 RepID=A0A6P8IIF4_ACTTE|nr:histone-lysine N-methyltransferase 2A-like [Actinia tenebrosa]